MNEVENTSMADTTDFNHAMDEFLSRVAERFCPECGMAVSQNATGRPKKFCSVRCRNLWWAKHQMPEHWVSARMKTCPVCGREFLSSRETIRPRMYCSHACANKGRVVRNQTMKERNRDE